MLPTLVSWSVVAWFGSAFLAGAGGLAQQDWWQLASRAIGLVAALLIFLAYHPPAALRRYGVVPLAAGGPLARPAGRRR
jgi:hypothetical protein